MKYTLHSEGKYEYSDATGQYQYDIKEHLGIVRLVVNGSGNVLQQRAYYPFGMQYMAGGSADNKYLYNGKELQDDAIGGGNLDWYDYGARMYDATLGRWHSIDPLAENYYSEGPYVFCGNNSILYFDPNGMDYWSTNDPEEIRRFMESLQSNSPNGNLSENFNYSSWNHASDAEFLGDITYNDQTNTLYSSYGTTINGEATRIGFSVQAFNVDENSAIIKGAKQRWYDQSSGGIDNTYPEFGIIAAGTKAGFAALKYVWNQFAQPNASTINTFDANKRIFSSGNKEKMGRAKGNMSGNREVQNKQFNDVAKKYNLTKAEREQFHRMVSKEGYGYKEMEQLAKEFFRK